MNKPKKVLITGGTSYLGQHMVPYFVKQGVEVQYTWRSTEPDGSFPGQGVQVDMRDLQRVEKIISDFRPDGIIHLAASNRNRDEQLMKLSIEEGARAIVSAAQNSQCRLLHMSTDVIFDGTASPYNEESPVAPPHAYGRAKANAEKTVKKYVDSVIIRPSLIYSLEIKDRSTEWMEASIKAGKKVTLFTNQLRNPVWTGTLSSACLELIDHSFRGVLNVVGAQTMSRAEFGTKLLDWWGIDAKNLVEQAPTPVDAPWPNDLRLDMSRATKLLETPLLGVDEVFALHPNR